MSPSSSSIQSERLRPLALLRDAIAVFLGVMLAAVSAEGIRYADNEALLWAALFLTLCNIVLKPLLILFALPFVIMTLGLGIWVINAVLFYLAGAWVPGFEVATFWAALWGALILSLINFLLFALFAPKPAHSRVRVQVNGRQWGYPRSRNRTKEETGGRRIRGKNDDVIDV